MAFGADNRVIKIILQAVDMASDVLEKTQRGWAGLTGFLKKEWDDTGASARKLLGEFKGLLSNTIVQGVGFAGLIAGLKKSWDASDRFEASLRKLDGTAKGGVLAAIARQSPKPVRFIGIGEGIDDLRPFVARDFVDAMFE